MTCLELWCATPRASAVARLLVDRVRFLLTHVFLAPLWIATRLTPLQCVPAFGNETVGCMPVQRLKCPCNLMPTDEKFLLIGAASGFPNVT